MALIGELITLINELMLFMTENSLINRKCYEFAENNISNRFTPLLINRVMPRINRFKPIMHRQIPNNNKHQNMPINPKNEPIGT